MDVIMMCLSLLQLLAFPMGTLSFSEVYKKYSGSAAMTGNSLNLTTAPSVIQCLRLCNGYEHMSIKVCDAARYNEGTGNCELMTRKSTGGVQWKFDDQWKVFVSKF
ncbi:hypothetical protein MAR_033753 [Mya arenaria]|uniref:Apple domain-containing protein n=1 Tax=Mya arenaria TaxID=6604 RepID=A0ABY7GIX9_MYAAR|nr:hypothetical protein MAR_033753 [Mya arenaria]